MSSDPTPAGDVDSRVDELQKRVAALTAALAAGRRVRSLIMLAFLAFVVISGWGFYSLARTIQSDAYKQQLIAELQKSVESHQDVFAGEAQKLADQISPVVTTALAEQSKKDMPLFLQAFDNEQQQFVAELPDQMVQKIEQRHHQLLIQNEKMLVEEFPAAQDPKIRDRVITNVELALDRLVKKYYAEEFQRQLLSMSKTWEEFKPAADPEKNDPPLDQQLLGELMDLVALKMTRHPNEGEIAAAP